MTEKKMPNDRHMLATLCAILNLNFMNLDPSTSGLLEAYDHANNEI